MSSSMIATSQRTAPEAPASGKRQLPDGVPSTATLSYREAHASCSPEEAPPGGRDVPRAWRPNADDHLIYQWVRFEGKRQTWVAAQLGISQATVSRAMARYERWKAHADPRDGGQLDPAERARAQRWLTYERNELIIASALRLADELEGITDTSKTVTSHPLAHPARESVVRRESNTIDRSGMVSRFLRLAHRVNMDQQKLVEQD